MGSIEGNSGLHDQTSSPHFNVSSSSGKCILPHHQRSPIIWCQEMADDLWGHSIEADIPTLRQARETGCETCTLVCEALATYKKIPMDQLSGRVIFSPGDFNVYWYFPLIGEDKENSGRVTLRISVTPDFPCHSSWEFSKTYRGKCNPLPARTDSDETFARVREWLKECTTSHDNCRSMAGRELPTRLIDLHKVESDGIARLIEGRDVPPEDDRYACLSHCWGGRLVEHATATKKSVEVMKRSIPVETLPRTFRDTLATTRKLNIRYLWIDSMCILQDDEDDWERESKKMSSVYQNSFITIAATCSPNSTQGFFSASSQYEPYPFECRTALGQPCKIYFQQRLHHHDDRLAESFQPLLKRAWVYQERLLSPRYLHFMLGEVVWDCNKHMVCQCEQTSSLGDYPSMNFGINQYYANIMRKKEVKGLKRIWHEVLRSYTYQALSFEKDRLRAVAGIVSHLSSVELPSNPGKPALGRYIEGLWEDTLCGDLCWSVEAQEKVNPRPRDWRKWNAPTWSWASVQDPSSGVRYEQCKKSTVNLAKIIEVTFIPHPQACQEQVQYNCIRLELSTAKVTLCERVRFDMKEKYFWGFCYWDLQINGNCLEKAGALPDYDYTIAGPDQITPGSPLLGGVMLETPNGTAAHFRGLLMVLVDEENALYKRIGSFSYNAISDAELSEFRSLFSEKRVISLI